MSRISAAAAQAAMLRTGQSADPSSGIARELLDQKYSIVKSNVTTQQQTLTFFQDNYAPGVTNLVRPGQVCDGGTSFAAHSLSIMVDVDWETNNDPEIPTVTGVAALTLGETLRKIINRGTIILNKGKRKIFEGYGIWNFPAGGGAVCDIAAATAVGGADLTIGAANVCNGDRRADNLRWFPTPILFNDTDNVSLQIDFGQTIALPTSDKIRYVCSLWGRTLSDAIN